MKSRSYVFRVALSVLVIFSALLLNTLTIRPVVAVSSPNNSMGETIINPANPPAALLVGATATQPTLLLGPTGSLTASAVRFRWKQISGVSSYYLWLTRLDGLTQQQWYRSDLVCTGTTCQTPPINLDAGDYSWWVQTYALGTGYGPWTAPNYLDLSTTPLSQPILISPSGTTTPYRNFRWRKVNQAASYLLEISNSAGATIIQKWVDAISDCPTGCMALIDESLVNGDYSWRVTAFAPFGMSEPSARSFFTASQPAPPAPLMVGPTTTIAESQPIFTWIKVGYASSYTLKVTGPKGVVITEEYPAVRCNQFCTVMAQHSLENGPYSWQVQSHGPGGDGPWRLQDFAVNVPLPDGAMLLSPSGVVNTATPTYDWQPAANATSYLLWVDGPGGNLTQTWVDAASYCDNTICSFLPPGLTLNNDNNYRWWIQSYGSAGYGPWSSSLGFMVNLNAPAPSLSGMEANRASGIPATLLYSPSGTTVLQSSVIFKWKPIVGVTAYYLWLSDPSGIVLQNWYRADVVCAVTPCQTTLTLRNGNYTWWVRTYAPRTGYGAWSNSANFAVAAAPPAPPRLIAPSGTITTGNPIFKWSKVTGATEYYLWVTKQGEGTYFYDLLDSATVCTTTCSVVLPNTLINGNYAFQVQAVGIAGSSVWPTALNFTINQLGPTQPALTGPTGTITVARPTFNWRPTLRTLSYTLMISGPKGLIFAKQYDSQDICTEALCSAVPDIDLDNAVYNWQVQAWGPGGFGPLSKIYIINITALRPAATTLISPSGTEPNSTPTYRWQVVSNVTEYRLWVASSAGPLVDVWLDAASLDCRDGICSYTPPSEYANGVMLGWAVQTRGPGGYGPWSLPLSYTVNTGGSGPMPAAPTPEPTFVPR